MKRLVTVTWPPRPRRDDDRVETLLLAAVVERARLDAAVGDAGARVWLRDLEGSAEAARVARRKGWRAS